MDIFYMTDQPETCRNCGVRTEFCETPTGAAQLHWCPACGYEYLLVEDEE